MGYSHTCLAAVIINDPRLDVVRVAHRYRDRRVSLRVSTRRGRRQVAARTKSAESHARRQDTPSPRGGDPPMTADPPISSRTHVFFYTKHILYRKTSLFIKKMFLWEKRILIFLKKNYSYMKNTLQT